MSWYAISLYLHIIGALGLFASLALEWAGLVNLRRSRTAGQLRSSVGLLGATRLVGGPAALTLLVTGIYLGATRWGNQGWILLGFLGMLAMAILGAGLTGRRMRPILQQLPADDGPVPATLAQRVHDPMLPLSAWLRTALGLGVVFLMSVKPAIGGSALALGVAAALGLTVGMSPWGRGRRARTVDSGPGAAPVPATTHPGEP